MKKALLLLSGLLISAVSASAETVNIGGTDYEIERKIERQIGPGTTHLRLRLPEYPLNVNVLMVDLNDPYNRIETTVANESARGTERLVKAAERQSYEGHKAIAGANANFWIVNTQPEDQVYVGITRNASIRNGKMITESNQHRDQWDGGTMRTGVVSLSYDKVLNIDYCTSSIKVWSDKFEATEVHQCNKGIWSDELSMYNSHYGSTTKFMPITTDPSTGKYKIDEQNDATEVILDFDEGQQWVSGSEMSFVVKEVRLDAGRGTLGEHDLALVGRGANRDLLAKLAAGDKVSLKYTWTYNPGTEQETTPAVEQAVGGNALVLRAGELTDHNYNETYNSQVYSRTGYGCSQDGKTLYIVVIDKATDPVYGASKGCPSSVMCEIARHLGCYNMANFDAGGSAEMLVDGAIINKTTESSPRAVANGWLVYSIAPEDNTVARLEFYDNVLQQPIYAAASPRMIAYNQYGAVIDYDFKDITFSCDASLGSCEGNVFTAGAEATTGLLTATCGNVSVSKEMTVLAAEIAMRSEAILIDSFREYTLEVVANNAGQEYVYDPAHLAWTVEDPSVASIDENGVLRGLANGTTTITGTIGAFTDQATVTVEIPTAHEAFVCELPAYEAKGSTGIKNTAMAADGTTTFEYASPRSPYIEFRLDDLKIYSLPDELCTYFNSPIAVESVQFSVQPANADRTVLVKNEPEGGFTPNADHRAEALLAENIDLTDICVYPLTLKYVRFNIKAASENKGTHSFKFGNVAAIYKAMESVEDIRISDELTANRDALRLAPNPVEAGSELSISAHGITAVAVYSISGSLISSAELPRCENATIEAPRSAGTYVVSATTAAGRKASILIVK